METRLVLHVAASHMHFAATWLAALALLTWASFGRPLAGWAEVLAFLALVVAGMGLAIVGLLVAADEARADRVGDGLPTMGQLRATILGGAIVALAFGVGVVRAVAHHWNW